MDVRITVGTAIQRTTEAIQSGVSGGAAGHRITTTALAAEQVAAHLAQHPVAVAPSAVPRGGRPLAVAAAPAVAALAHQPHAHLLVVEVPERVAEVSVRHPRVHRLVVAHAQVVEALAHHRREHRLVEDQPLHQVAASVHHGPGVPAPSDRAHRPAALVQHVLRLEEALAQVEGGSSEEAAAVPALVVAASLEAAPVPAEEASLVGGAAAVAPVGLVALEVAVDDRFSLCNRRRLGFDHAA